MAWYELYFWWAVFWSSFWALVTILWFVGSVAYTWFCRWRFPPVVVESQVTADEPLPAFLYNPQLQPTPPLNIYVPHTGSPVPPWPQPYTGTPWTTTTWGTCGALGSVLGGLLGSAFSPGNYADLQNVQSSTGP